MYPDRLLPDRWWRYDAPMADLNRMAHRIVQHATEPPDE
jgi:hypothetical protein